MKSKRPFLFLIVSDYPYGFGEPFLEVELKIISVYFEKIYLILPEKINKSKNKPLFIIPQNAEIIELDSSINIVNKITSLRFFYTKSWKMERSAINSLYKQSFNFFHLKTLLGFQAKASFFAKKLEKLIFSLGHPLESVLIYNYWFSYFTAGTAKIKEKFPKIKVITRSHRWDCFFYANPNNYLPLRPWSIQTIDGVFPISEAGVKHTKEMLPQNISYNIKCYRLGIEDLALPKTKLKVKGKLRIISIAFISLVKRIDKIIDALAETNHSEFNWTHIGASSAADNLDIQHYARKKLQNKINVKFEFLGEMSKNEIYEFLQSQQIDILLCTSDSEGIPVSMMEALGHGIPIVSLNIGGVNEIVINGQNGELLQPDANANRIASSLEKWATMDFLEYETFSKNGYEVYLKRYSASKNYQTFYNEVLNQ